MSATRLMLLAMPAIILAGGPAKAETFDYRSVNADPSTYEGPCPVPIKLASVIKFDVVMNHDEKFYYRWESNDESLTDYVVTFSRGRTNHVEGVVLLKGPVGKKLTVPIRLHAAWGITFGKTPQYNGLSANDHYSSPTDVTVTCR